MSDTRIAVLAGGLAFEREVSLLSGRRVLRALLDDGHSAELVEPGERLLTEMEGFDIAFLAVHGRIGEDGVIQSLFDLVRQPYTGSGALASTIAFNKPVAKELLVRNGVPTPAFVLLPSAAFLELGGSQAVERVGDVLGGELVVKPSKGGSAMGVQRIDSPDQLKAGVMQALMYANVALVERRIHGTEVAVSILDGEALPPVEIHSKSTFYDYSARYTAGATRFFAPARLPADVLEEVTAVSMRAWEVLGARHIARVDLIVDEDGVPWVLELATCPGLTDNSVYPVAAQSAGLTFEAAVQRILAAATRDSAL